MMLPATYYTQIQVIVVAVMVSTYADLLVGCMVILLFVNPLDGRWESKSTFDELVAATVVVQLLSSGQSRVRYCDGTRELL
jgi:hypothetical protein